MNFPPFSPPKVPKIKNSHTFFFSLSFLRKVFLQKMKSENSRSIGTQTDPSSGATQTEGMRYYDIVRDERGRAYVVGGGLTDSNAPPPPKKDPRKHSYEIDTDSKPTVRRKLVFK